MTAILTVAGKQLYIGVHNNPTDKLTRLAYSDWLEEQGNTTEAVFQRRFADAIENPLTTEQLGKLEQTLGHANGRRRTRTLTLDDCLDVARKALLDSEGFYYRGGDTVANAYGYRAYRTVCVAAVKKDRLSVRVGVAVGNAKGGSSVTSPVCGLYKNSKPELFRQWADQEKI